MSSLPRTGFIGLGHMGGAIAQRLLQTDHDVAVFDLDSARINALASQGALRAASVRELGDQVEILYLCLPSPEATRTVVSQLRGAQALRILVETSTVGPIAVRETVASLESSRVQMIDAPVSGGPRGAQAGTLSIMYSGEPAIVSQVLPQFRAIAGRLFEVGDVPGQAQICKLVNNAISAAGMMAACEATVLGVKAGLDPDTMLAAINAGSGRNAATLDKFPKSILTGTFDFGGPMGLMLKDLTLFIEQARQHGIPSSLADSTLQAWSTAVERTGFDADYVNVIRHLEIDAGVEVRSRGVQPLPSLPQE